MHCPLGTASAGGRDSWDWQNTQSLLEWEIAPTQTVDKLWPDPCGVGILPSAIVTGSLSEYSLG